MGRRLREFEVEWGRTKDAGAKARAILTLKESADAILSIQPGDAGRAITDATFALRGGEGPIVGEGWAASLCVQPEARLIDATQPNLVVTITSFYTTTAKKPDNGTVRLTLGGSAISRVDAPIGPLPMTLSLPIKGIAAGESTLVAEVRAGEKTLVRTSQTISLADQLDDRISALRKTIGTWPEDAASATLDRESARGQLRLLEFLAAKMTLDSDFPANQILAELEAQVLAVEQSESYLSKDRAGEARLTILTGTGRRLPARLFVPEAAAKGVLLPIVVALHGAGGSENQYFEAYGRGAIVDRCRERGWFLVAPRGSAYGGSPVAEIVDELARVYPVDPKRVMLVGHSLGVTQAMDAVCLEPARYAAVAALGGGGSVVARPGIKSLPFFVGVGSEDFALQGSKNLVEQLSRASVSDVIFREYPNIEQLTIVPVALPDVFQFFDERAKPK